ncbi:MAG: hypothetical protein V7K92_30440 [Nostoc sp.]
MTQPKDLGAFAPLGRKQLLGTLNAILRDVAHAGLTRDELLTLLFP